MTQYKLEYKHDEWTVRLAALMFYGLSYLFETRLGNCTWKSDPSRPIPSVPSTHLPQRPAFRSSDLSVRWG
jgi:hypothetical protein